MSAATIPGVVLRRIETDAAGCWLWTGNLSPDGYGRSGTHKRYGTSLPHKVAWEAVNGSVPEGLELDHLCRVRRCVNPEHLEAVTHDENTRRAWADRTHCRTGRHSIEFQVSDYAGGRRCLLCRRESNAAAMRRRRAVA